MQNPESQTDLEPSQIIAEVDLTSENKEVETQIQHLTADLSDQELETVVQRLLNQRTKAQPSTSSQTHLTLGVIDPTETKRANVQVPRDVTVGYAIKKIVDSMSLPLLGQWGQKNFYYLSAKDEEGNLRQLKNRDTFEQSQVQDGDVLQLMVGTTRTDPSPLSQISFDMRINSLEEEVRGIRDTLQNIEDLLRSQTIGPPPENGSEEDLDEEYSLIPYVDFDIIFSEASSGKYHAKAMGVIGNERLHGERQFQMPVTLTDLEYDYLLNMRLASRSDSLARLAEGLGDKLFQTVFAGTIQDCFRKCQSWAYSEEYGIRIRMDFRDAPELINYPWEFLWCEGDNGFLACSDRTPVIRYLQGIRPTRDTELGPPMRMLVVTASPSGYAPLDIAQEKENLSRALERLYRANLLEIEWLDNATPSKLRQILRRNRGVNILHYIGHGDIDESGGYLVLEGEAGPTKVRVERLSTLLGTCHKLRLVTLNTCRGARATANDPFASIAMGLIRANIPVVVAMQHEIHDRTAIHFSRVFYEYLAKGCSVDTAMSEVRMSLYFDQEADIEWAIPALYSRLPDGVIFKKSLILTFSVVTGDNLPSRQRSRDYGASCRDTRNR